MTDQPPPEIVPDITWDRRAQYERKRRQLNISLTPDEYALLRRMAAEHGHVVTNLDADKRRLKKPAPAPLAAAIIRAWLRELAGGDQQISAPLSPLETPSPDTAKTAPHAQRNDLRALVMEVRRLGTNINQAVKLAQMLKVRKSFFGRQVNYDRELAQVWAEVTRLVELLETALKRS